MNEISTNWAACIVYYQDQESLLNLLESLERYEEALGSFVCATELAPKLDRAWYGLGMTLIRLGRYDDAAEALRKNTQLQIWSRTCCVECAWHNRNRGTICTTHHLLKLIGVVLHTA